MSAEHRLGQPDRGSGRARRHHLYPNQKVTHDDPLHWTGAFQNWNSRCASCHSTGLVRDYSSETNRYDTRWQEINVACEACHGQGSRHVAWAKGQGSIPRIKDSSTRLGKVWEPANGRRPALPPVDFAMSDQIQVCSSCHSLRLELQQTNLAASYFDNYKLSPLLEGRYHADGQIEAEVYETGSFLQSRMHENHVSCTNCHEPHSGKVRMTGNKLCLQCHEPAQYQTRDHFFHEPDSAGGQCVNCHMPTETYMGVHVRRDHSFHVPDPVASVAFGVPNACTQCHKDRDNRVGRDIVTKRTGDRDFRYPRDGAVPDGRAEEFPPSVTLGLLAYAPDTKNPPILRSIAILESARFPAPQQVEALNAALVLVRSAGADAGRFGA